MIDLYKYLRESIFDDEDVISKSADTDIIDMRLKELDELFASKWGKSPLYSRLVNDTLLLLDSKYKGIDPKIYDKIKDIREITGFTNIRTKGLMLFDAPVIDSALGDEIISTRMKFNKSVNIVKDIQLTFDNQMDYYGYILQSEDDVTFQNVEFKYNIRDISSFESAFFFYGFPTFKNCYNFKGLKQIYIYKHEAFKDQEIIKKLNNFLDDKHVATYRDGKIADKYHKRKGDLKTVATVVKMPKKYIFDSSENGKSFKIKPNAKLKDLLDVDGFKDLNCIRIADDSMGVRVDFHKGELTPVFTEQSYCAKLPNDDWYMAIVKITK